MDLVQALERWGITSNRAPRTLETYRYSLARLARLANIRTTEDVSPARIADYLAERARVASPYLANVDLTAILSPLGRLARSGQFPRDLFAELKAQRLQGTTRRRRQFRAPFLVRDQFRTLQAAAGMVTRAKWPAAELEPRRARTRFLATYATLSGLRTGELARSHWREVDTRSREISVLWRDELGQAGRIKNYKERRVPICEELLVAIEAYRELSGGEGFLFRSGNRARLNAHAYPKELRRDLALAVAGAELGPLPYAVSFQLLRHTRASWWVQAGAPPAKVADWLGDTLDVVLTYYVGLMTGYDPDCERMPA